MKIKMSDIRIDGGTQSRDVIDQQQIAVYAEDMKKGDKFPVVSLMFDGSTYWLYDGFHRYFAAKQLGLKEVGADVQNGTQLEAQVASFSVNATHGLPRTPATRRRSVELALAHPLTKDLPMAEIARICNVSPPFVAAIKNPEAKEKQKQAQIRHKIKVAKSLEEGPEKEEMEATERAVQADMETMHKLLSADDKLTEAYEEIKRLNHLNAQLEIRLKGLMNEKNEAIKMVKELQRELEKVKQ